MAQEGHVCSSDTCFHAVMILSPLSTSPDTLPVDTGLAMTWRPDIFTRKVWFPALKGTSGQPGMDMFRHFTVTTEDYFWHNPYEDYQINADNLQVIRTNVPYSEWYYLLGANKEQLFRAVHALDAGKNFNFGLDLKFINNKGAYQHEHAKASCLGFYAQYRDPKLPLQGDLYMFFNGATTEESGGISAVTYFEGNKKINRELIPVWLRQAQNRHRSTEILLRGRWYPGAGPGGQGQPVSKAATRQSVLVTDTLNSEDSLSAGSDKNLVTRMLESGRKMQHHFFLDIGVKRTWFLYSDPEPFNPWYTLTRYDTTVTYDSLCHNALTTSLGYHLLAWRRVDVSMGIRWQGYQFYDTLDPAGSGSSLTPFTNWSLSLLPSLRLSAEASATYDKAFGLSHHLHASLLWKLAGKLSLTVNAKDWTAFPCRQDLQYASNHFLWMNEMENQHFTQFNPELEWKGRFPVALKGFVTRVGKPIYYNQHALPNQYMGTVMLYQLLLTSQGMLGRFSYDMTFALQKSTESWLYRQPVLLGELMGGVRFGLFKGKISAMGGVILHGRSEAYLDEYMPVTRVFYHTTRAPMKAYIWADPYFTFLLKKTRFMLKYEHATAWLAGFGQYSLPGYPMTDPALKFSVSWRFMD